MKLIGLLGGVLLGTVACAGTPSGPPLPAPSVATPAIRTPIPTLARNISPVVVRSATPTLIVPPTAEATGVPVLPPAIVGAAPYSEAKSPDLILSAVGQSGDLTIQARVAHATLVDAYQQLDITVADGRGPVRGAGVEFFIRSTPGSGRMRAVDTNAQGVTQKIWKVYRPIGLVQLLIYATAPDGRQVSATLRFMGARGEQTPAPTSAAL